MGNIFNTDFQDFIMAFNAAQVEYMLIGGYSVILHGYERVTGDMDIWVNKTAQNYQKIERAFSVFGMPVFDMKEENFLSEKESAEVFRFGISPTRIDLMTTVKGMKFDECFLLAEWFETDGIKVKVIHYNQLIESKIKSDRVKDRIDIENLKKNKK